MNIARRAVLKAAAGMAALAALAGWSPQAMAQEEPLSIALGDVASLENLNLLIAVERTKEAGVPMEVSFFNSEDLAVQAVLGGQADIGVGAPYAFIQNAEAPIRMFFKMSNLLFFPVVNSEVYSGWEDLDGQEVTVHSRGSGTEALMKLMANRHGIEFSNISYVPGSEVRAGAMLKGTVDASIVDAPNFRMLQEEGGGKFERLPTGDVSATDEALYATKTTLEQRSDDIEVFVEQLLRTWEDIAANPEIVGELRDEYGLLPDLPAGATEEAVAYYKDAVEQGVYPTGGGTPEAAQNDLEFLAAAGQVEAGEDVNPANYWDFSALNAVKGE